MQNIAREIREAIMDEFAFDIDTDPESDNIIFTSENEDIIFSEEKKNSQESGYERFDATKNYDEDDDELEFLDEPEEENRVKVYFDLLKKKNYYLYKQIIGVVFVDYYVNLLGYNLMEVEDDYQAVDLAQFRHFENSHDVVLFLEENPEYFMPMLGGCLEFCLAEPEEKRSLLNLCRGMERYLMAINPFHMLDRVEYCRNLTKEDVILKHRNILQDYEEMTEYENKEIEEVIEDRELNNDLAIYDTAHYLRNIFSFNEKNYRLLILDILEDYYKYELYKGLNKQDVNEEIIDIIEKNNLSDLVEITIEDQTGLVDILSPFIEYHRQDKKFQKKVNGEIKKIGKADIKKKILRRENWY